MTGSPTFVRARSADQIEQRRGDILAAAADLLLEEGFDDISLNGIARRAGIAKSNLYRYFTGKEEILFEVMVRDYTDWFADISARLQTLPVGAGVAVVAKSFSQSLHGRDRLCTFISVKALVLERNMSEETVGRFSSYLRGRAEGLLAVLLAGIGGIDADQGPFILRALHAAIAGLWPMSHHVHGDDFPTDWLVDFHRDLEAMAKGIFLVAHQGGDGHG